MCGIVGAFAVDANHGRVQTLAKAVQQMSLDLRHRGPDGEGFVCSPDGSFAVAHRRLSIIDLSSAASQPMESPSGKILTYNGEIYNYQEIRQSLESVWSFRTSSDTEVLLAALETFGLEALEKIRGMFSFALIDPKRPYLLCARDRLGMKPFYYTVSDGVFFFSSEMKALLPQLAHRRVNVEALADYFAFQYSIRTETLVSGIFELPPGNVLEISGGELKTREYWSVSSISDSNLAVDGELSLRSLLTSSVKEHLQSDVEVGSYVSGGLDSSIVFATARRAGGVERAFHGYFDEGKDFDESIYARDLIGLVGGSLKEVEIRPEDFLRVQGDLVRSLDFPVAGPGAFPQFVMAGEVSKWVKVVLGGQGGDELFGGYARYSVALLAALIRNGLSGVDRRDDDFWMSPTLLKSLGALTNYRSMFSRNLGQGLELSGPAHYYSLVNRSEIFERALVSEITRPEATWSAFEDVFGAEEKSAAGFLRQVLAYEVRYELPALLQVDDRVSMAHGLEARLPFLDHRVVERALRSPVEAMLSDDGPKGVLRNSFSDLLPQSLQRRQDKMGFPVPFDSWFEGPLREFKNDTLGSQKARSRDYIETNEMPAAIESETRFSRKTWALLQMELWHQEFIDY